MTSQWELWCYWGRCSWNPLRLTDGCLSDKTLSVFVGGSKQRANYAAEWMIRRMSCAHSIKNVDVEKCVIGDLLIHMDETTLFCWHLLSVCVCVGGPLRRLGAWRICFHWNNVLQIKHAARPVARRLFYCAIKWAGSASCVIYGHSDDSSPFAHA